MDARNAPAVKAPGSGSRPRGRHNATMLLALSLMLGALPAFSSGGQGTEPVSTASTPPSVIVPQSRVLARPGTSQTVGIREVGSQITIREQVASTTLTMVLFNPTGSAQEAQIIMPVPDGSTVRAFVMEGMPNEGQAQIYARDEARKIYESIVRSMRDPGLVEFAGLNLIRTSVFPVPPGGTQKVHLTYEQVLHADGNRVDYLLPRTESLERSDIAWSIRLSIESSRPISTVYSPSHELVVERTPRGATIAVTSAADPGSFRLSYIQEQQPGEGLGASMLAYPDATVSPDGGYMLLVAGIPELPSDRPSLKREVIVAIDTSGSMRGQKLEQARAAALQVIEALADGEAFNIITYSDSVTLFSATPVTRSEESVARARAYLADIRAMGGTNIHDAIVEAMRQPPSGDAKTTIPLVLFLTDGLATVGKRSEVAIREAAVSANLHKRRIFTFGVGFDVNAPLLSALAQSSRATSTFVLPSEDVEVKVGQVFKRLSGPVLAEPKLTVLGADGTTTPAGALRDLLPAELPDLFEGDQLILLGRYTSSKPVRVAIEGNYLGTPRRFEYDFDFSAASTANGFVPRLWASRRIAVLVDAIRQATADGGLSTSGTNVVASDPKLKELVDEIVRLSTEFGILTEYTAFLAVEEGAMAGLPTFRSMPAPGAAPDAAPEFDLSGVVEGRERALESISTRAVGDRAGAGGVNQSVNLGKQVAQSKANARNVYFDAEFNTVQTTSVKQVGDQTLYRRDGVWMDARITNIEQAKAARTIEFASDDYFSLVAKLAREGRQGMLAERADTVLLIDSELLLVKGPGA